tara:strand:+ start:61 stop:588 length:528 start_codon:yes stop_codon:yes gene_type:complete
MKRVTSAKNFASKIGFFTEKPEYLKRSSKTQNAIEKSKKFYVQEEVKKQVLLEQQLSYKEKELSRPDIEKPSNIITLKNGTRWFFDIKKQRYINVDTLEELTVSQYMTYTAMVAMMREEEEENSYDDTDAVAFGISDIAISTSGANIAIDGTVTATPSTKGGSAVSYSYEWSVVG